jgi:hypothetical protein
MCEFMQRKIIQIQYEKGLENFFKKTKGSLLSHCQAGPACHPSPPTVLLLPVLAATTEALPAPTISPVTRPF